MNWRLRIMFLGASVYWWLFRPLTLGVKLLLIHQGQVLLVRHTYQSGWFLPGGGVKKQEYMIAAAQREVREELGAEVRDLQLFGLYSNVIGRRNDQVVVFCSEAFRLGETDRVEIAAAEFFPPDRLPADVSPGTARRVGEYAEWKAERRPFVRIW